MNQAVISFQHVTKTFKKDIAKKAIHALTDLSFQVQRGEVLGIIGSNGAGKSTTLKILMGFIRHDHGKVHLNKLSPINPLSRKQLGYLPENPCLYKHLTIRDHLKFTAKINRIPRSEIKKKIPEILERVNLQDSINVPIRDFSKGMTQRGALAYALLHEPTILILDEPMSGLDPVGRQLVLDIIMERKTEGTTTLFCSHILTDVERICSRISIMHHGRISATITPAELNRQVPCQKNDLQSPLESFFFQTIRSDTVKP